MLLSHRSTDCVPEWITTFQRSLRWCILARHLEIRPVILSAAKDLARRTQRSFAALRMTGQTPLKSVHGRPSLQMS